jgi:tRNA(fMet)-specific endonuclease VapC
MSSITYGELLYGAEKSQHPKNARDILIELSTLIPPLPLAIDISEHYAKIRAALEKQGKPIGNNDLWISAHARALNVILVTNNVRALA